jgi:2-phospho-L-lactate guanylyltransferase
MRRSAGMARVDGSVVLVPVKAFAKAKARLAPTLDPEQRASLARAMAERVLAAASPLLVAVVCDDDDVASWAAAHGAIVLDEPGRGLNGAVQTGVARLGAAGATEVLVVHGDLPLAEGIVPLAGYPGISLVPDRRDDGTTVVGVPPSAGFRFSYGPGSFARHVAEAKRLGYVPRIVRAAALRADVDEPGDLPLSLALWESR